MTTDRPNTLDAVAAARAIASGELTSEALVQACLARIAEREETIGAWQYLDRDLALAQARDADARQARGAPLGALHGVPVGIKDIIDTADMPTENGSPLFEGRRTNDDATCVRALREAGAVILGKTVTTELANVHPGRTRNPHDPGHTPGGSSSGSAAGVADNHVPLALGTQTGGSVIRPASFCGIYGLKPTLGLISRRGVLLQSHSLDTVGVYGRSVADLALITDALSAQDPEDPASYPRVRGSLLHAAGRPATRPLKLAFLRTPAWSVASDGARSALEGLVSDLGEACVETNLPGPFDRVVDLHRTVMAAEDLAYYGDFLEHSPQLLSDALRARLEDGRAVAASDYIHALNAREIIYADLCRLLAGHDAVLCLASTGPAPEGLESTGDAICNGLWTYLGVPCVTLPRLEVDGLPMGVQLVGLRNQEGDLLRTARCLDERLRGA